MDQQVWEDHGSCHMSGCSAPTHRRVTLANGAYEVTKSLCTEHHDLAHDLAENKITEMVACEAPVR